MVKLLLNGKAMDQYVSFYVYIYIYIYIYIYALSGIFTSSNDVFHVLEAIFLFFHSEQYLSYNLIEK